MSNVIQFRERNRTRRRQRTLDVGPWTTPSGNVDVAIHIQIAVTHPGDADRLSVATRLRDVADLLDSEPGKATWEGRS